MKRTPVYHSVAETIDEDPSWLEFSFRDARGFEHAYRVALPRDEPPDALHRNTEEIQ